MFSELRELRNLLIINKDEITYRKIIKLMEDPTTKACEEVRNLLQKYHKSELIERIINNLINLFIKDKSLYRKQIIMGQAIIWNEVLECIKIIEKNYECIKNYKIIDYKQNYNKNKQMVEDILKFYIDSQSAASRMETNIGVDRYLDTLAEKDLEMINRKLEEQRKLLNEKLIEYIDRFQVYWGNNNIANAVYHKLYKYDSNNDICNSLKANQKKVILFVVDGMGWCQYQWHKEICSAGKGYAYKESIFQWLVDTGNCNELILGAPFITDTAAGLSQIFTGLKGDKTGVFASKLMDGRKIIETKKQTKENFKSVFKKQQTSIHEVLNILGYSNEALYCTRYNKRFEGFSNYIFQSAKITEVLPPERVYNVLLNRIMNDKLSDFTTVYLTAIDNTGHTMGAFSRLEKYEHEKLDMQVKNFILQLAEKREDFFDGNTSILFTADHGMAETGHSMIYRGEINKLLNDFRNVNTCVNNRALFIYGIHEEDYEMVMKRLQDYFDKKSIKVEITTNKNEFMRNLVANSSVSQNLIPNIVVRLIDNALFFHADEIDENLFHFAGHGGCSISETFVPLIEINCTDKLLRDIKARFGSMI